MAACSQSRQEQVAFSEAMRQLFEAEPAGTPPVPDYIYALWRHSRAVTPDPHPELLLLSTDLGQLIETATKLYNMFLHVAVTRSINGQPYSGTTTKLYLGPLMMLQQRHQAGELTE